MLFGYAVTAIVVASFVGLLASIVIGRRELYDALRPGINKYSVAGLVLLICFFVAFSILYVSPVEQLYFDENIYQGIALNILHSGNALWCQYGSAYLTACGSNQVYHDPVGWSVFIAMAFALFGVSSGTAYALQLLVGVLSILGVFLLSAVLFQRKDVPLFAAVFIALNPQLFIWSRTQAVADLPFMMLTVFAFLFLAVFLRRKGTWPLAMTAFALVLVAYTRIEAMLLVPIFAVVCLFAGDGGLAANARLRIASLRRVLRSWGPFLVLALLIVLLVPQAMYIVSQAQVGDYGQGAGSQLLSLANLKSNFYPNLEFVLGELNYAYNYPVAFPFEITLAAAIGGALLALDRKQGMRSLILLILGLWIFAYYIFYDFFYAGSVLYGVDVRFMLEILPPLAIAAGAGVAELSRVAAAAAARSWGRRRARNARKARAVAYAASALLIAALAVYPFLSLLPSITVKPQDMPQQSTALSAVNFIYANYTAVPADCLVFSFTPDIWYALNRSSAQIGYLGSTNSTFTAFASGYSCFVLDYGYWCQIPPYQNTTCSSALDRYRLTPLAATSNTLGDGLGIYLIQNYTNR